MIALRFSGWVFAFLFVSQAAAGLCAPVYSGALTAPDGIAGTGIWVVQPDSEHYSDWVPATISWSICPVSGIWHYRYEFVVYRTAISHFILQVSPTFTPSDILNPTGSFGSFEIGTYSPDGFGKSNSYLPQSIYGVKFDDVDATELIIDFYSPRAPVYGSFYARGGFVGGQWNTAWNRGLTSPESGAWIPVPDTCPTCPSVPEPTSSTVFGALLLGTWFIRRKA